MKYILFFLLLALTAQSISAQSVGIGTTTPNIRAALDISSSNKGVLFPRMTTSQRLTITTPPNGLMVYDTDKNTLHHYDGTSWRAILNSDYWLKPITNRNIISNATDSVGIGFNTPSERLDINGNIRSRNNLLVDNSVIAAGNVNGASFTTLGNITIGGTSLLNGDITTNSGLTINDAAATLQLKSSSVDKGFVQLSGDNLRLGTNSGNTNGRIILRSAGIDWMTVFENGNINIGSSAANAAKLRVAGDISVQDNVIVQDNIIVGGNITTNTTGTSHNLIPLCYGTVSRQGILLSGTDNVSISVVMIDGVTGYWQVSCLGINSNSIFIATSGSHFEEAGINSINMRYLSPGVAKVATYFTYFATAGGSSMSPEAFSFVVYK